MTEAVTASLPVGPSSVNRALGDKKPCYERNAVAITQMCGSHTSDRRLAHLTE